MPEQGTNNKNGQKQEILQARPSLEQIAARYEKMQIEIRDRLSAETGPWGWYDFGKPTAAGCHDFPNTEGESRGLQQWAFRGNLPDDKWPRAARIVQQVTQNYGFQAPVALNDKPGAHQFTVDDQYGARLTFGTGKNTLFGMETGCHLPQAEKDKTAPKPQGQAEPDAPDNSTPHAAEPTRSTPDFGPFDPARFSSRHHS